MNDSTEEDKELQIYLIRGIFDTTLPKLRVGEVLPTLPINVEDANRMILRNRFSMRRQHPIEGLVRMDELHAYSSIERTIDIMMGKGIRPSFIQDEFGNRNSNGLNGTAAADDILKYLKEEAERSGRDPNKVAIGWITLWSGKCIFQCVTVCNYYYSEGGVLYNQIVLFQRLINSFSMMIALLMRIDYVEEVVLERAIKLFLSCWSYCENSFGRSFTRNEINEEDDSTNSIFNKGNFLCEILRTIKISLGG